MGQLMRKASSSLLLLAKDSRVSSRLSQSMSQIKNLDLVSVRGQRQVGVGIQTAAGKKILKGFDFNNRAPMDTVFRGELDLDVVTGAVTLTDFNPAVHLAVPEGATHVSLSTAMSKIDFDEAVYKTRYSNKENLSITEATGTYTLTPSEIPPGTGQAFHYFLMEFFQEINGIPYPLKNNAYNVLHVLDVI
jgi:hypothetical protein